MFSSLSREIINKLSKGSRKYVLCTFKTQSFSIVNGNGSDRTSQIKNLIGRMAKNMGAARAARTLE